MRLQLNWDDPDRGPQQSIVSPPIAVGRDIDELPLVLDGDTVERVVLSGNSVSRLHAVLVCEDDRIAIEDRSKNGTMVNGQLLHNGRALLSNGAVLDIGDYRLTVILEPVGVTEPDPFDDRDRTIVGDPSDDATVIIDAVPTEFGPDAVVEPPQSSPPPTSALSFSSFPPPNFLQPDRVSIKELYATGDPVAETTFAALGGGIGSFCWVNAVRLYGARTTDIAVISLDPKPYTRYQRLCENSQIPPHERLRSSSDSCPDNFWGWPGYAWREAWYKLQVGNVIGAGKLLWQVFAEPVASDTYTPQSGKVFASLDREAERIGWQDMLRFGRIRGIRKTDDGRYAIAYSIPNASQRQHCYLLAPYVHLATGYSGVRFLPDLQEYRARSKDFQSVVNAYEDHNHIYRQLEQNGGTVIVRGRGIVASRIIQRLWEARQKNSNLKLIHLMRSSKTSGNRFGLSQRPIEHQWEFQPFNWPKAAWSGELREMFEKAGPERRKQLLEDWGGTTTPSRKDWRQITAEGLKDGWYVTVFGQVEAVDRSNNGKIVSTVKSRSFNGTLTVESDFIIDGTGLDANLRVNPLMDDLVGHYHLPLNVAGRLQVAEDFELVEMRNNRGKMFAAGVITLGGPNPAVDSFLGLQYAAQRSLDALVAAKAPGLKYLDGLRSVLQWGKWALNAAP